MPELKPTIAALARGGLRAAIPQLIALSPETRSVLVSAVAEAAARFVAAHDPEFINTYRWAASLAETYPGDPGVVISLMCNHLKLAPGEAVFLPAGNLHAYLSGAGVEVMASSDNVLRGGLTGKHVDLAALIEVLDFTDGRVPVIHPVLGPGGLRYPVPVEDFDLTRCQLDAQSGVAHHPGPPGAAVHRGHRRPELGRRRADAGEGRVGLRPRGHAGERLAGPPSSTGRRPTSADPRRPGRGAPSHSVRVGLRNGCGHDVLWTTVRAPPKPRLARSIRRPP